MKKLHVWLKVCFHVIIWKCLLIGTMHSQANSVPLKFNPLSAFEDLPSEEVTQIIQDSRGFLWFATHAGLCRYDGYRLHIYKDNLYMPGLLSNNKIKSLAEDKNNTLWIGTEYGINKMDLITGHIQSYTEGVVNDVIATIYVTSDNDVWAGVDAGLLRYDRENDRFKLYNTSTAGNNLIGVKSIYEDSNGSLWIGTWAYGIFRYDPENDIMIAYPPINDRNSVHVIFQDSKGDMWIGSWARGLYKMMDPESPETVKWKQYKYEENNKYAVSDNVIYCIEEDLNNQTLWIGTRNGLSILNLNDPYPRFMNYLPEDKDNSLPYNELNTIVRDKSGVMWLGMLGGGVYSVNMSHSPFEGYTLESIKQAIFSNSVRHILVDSDETLWLGIGSHGLAIQEKSMKEPVFYTEYPGFDKEPNLHTVNCILERKDPKEIWISIAGNGIYIYDKNQTSNKIRKLNPMNTKWLPEWFILSMLEDRTGNIWLGGRNELFLLLSNGDTRNILLGLNCNALVEVPDQGVWIATNQGIAYYKGNPAEIEESKLKWYNSANGKLPFDNIGCLFSDSRGNIWVGSEGGGLNLYERETDSFIQVNEKYNLLADGIYSIEEDDEGHLWIATSSTGLIRLNISEDMQFASSRTYTTSDGLQDNYFTLNASCKAPDGKLYFGCHNGYNAFYPENIDEKGFYPQVVITDISIFNQSLKDMEENQVREITDKTADFAEKIVLDHKRNHFSIEFSVLSYANPSRNKFAYWLEGYDNEWQFTGASNRMANYNNLKSGTYLFHLKGANENGLWGENERLLQIVILPPPWKTTWAYTLYILAGVILAFIVYRLAQQRLRQKQMDQIRVLEQAKAEEINHAKLQFFTNITHEFLTPLTILSASLDDLKINNPQNQFSYKVMYENLNRLFRLLQQILEFRKAETGNLKLKVSEGNITAFVQKEVDAFAPLIKKKK
ncbi:MAG: hybrid sensor histidine kinase/response regulator, partial [Tannerellaceae bacterium]|nr:hybrid sensor histidine kinase/response regulator [Tannerellaceae bacterium]